MIRESCRAVAPAHVQRIDGVSCNRAGVAVRRQIGGASLLLVLLLLLLLVLVLLELVLLLLKNVQSSVLRLHVCQRCGLM